MLSRDHAGFGSLQIAVRFTPSIFVHDIRKSDEADWPEPAHGIADRMTVANSHCAVVILARMSPITSRRWWRTSILCTSARRTTALIAFG